MIKYCTCGVEIPQARVEFLEKTNQPLTCINHSSAKKVAGYNLRSHKSTGELVIASQETVDLFHKISARTNGIVANGVRMRKAK